ncbi:MAG: hypothetical protein VW518_01925, partial [Burkholderiaceae bacterium]
KFEDTANADGVVTPSHEIELICAICGYDLDAAELEADTCSDCNEPLNLKQSVSIVVTTLPVLFGDTM